MNELLIYMNIFIMNNKYSFLFVISNKFQKKIISKKWFLRLFIICSHKWNGIIIIRNCWCCLEKIVFLKNRFFFYRFFKKPAFGKTGFLKKNVYLKKKTVFQKTGFLKKRFLDTESEKRHVGKSYKLGTKRRRLRPKKLQVKKAKGEGPPTEVRFAISQRRASKPWGPWGYFW